MSKVEIMVTHSLIGLLQCLNKLHSCLITSVCCVMFLKSEGKW